MMVAKCCINGCESEKYPGCEMTFHGFPTDEKLKTKWIEATRVTGNVKYKRICPLHFKDEDFVTKGAVIRLKQNAIPSICIPPFRKFPNNKVIFKSCNISSITDIQDCDINYGNIPPDVHVDISDDDHLRENNGGLNVNTLSKLSQSTKVASGIARCKCCLENNKLKGMWQEHCSGGQREVYGIMLTECFALHWSRPQNCNNSPDLICESCIARLRDAVNFKTEVLASEQLLSAQLERVDVDKLKQERDDVDVNIRTEYLHYEYLEESIDNHDVEDNRDENDGTDDKFNDGKVNGTEDEIDITVKSEPILSSNDIMSVSNVQTSGRRKTVVARKKRDVPRKVTNSADCNSITVVKKFKISNKSNSNISKYEDNLIPPVCKRITKLEISDSEDLTDNYKKTIEAIQVNKEAETIIAKDYGERRATAKDSSKMQKIIDDDDEEKDSKKSIAEIKEELTIKKKGRYINDPDIEMPNENRLAEMKKQANNIAIILESTNATPIRRHGGIGYGCCFCNDEFPDPADLKQHTIKEHDMKTKRNYAKGKRPSAYLVKLDITALKCNLCGNTISSLELLYDHLIEVHKKLLYKNAKNYIVPFKFDQEELRCLFCEFICNSFKGLLEHMSVHYRNHICEICNAGFLTKNNLFNHAGRHKTGTFKCDYCPKVFDTSSKKAGHQRLVHSSTNGVNRCGYCGEMFGTYRRKEKHLINEHGVTLKKLKCKACDKTFETQTALRIHTKRDHLIERRFKCSVCDKRCFTNVQLNQHILKHTGVKKFQCTICLKAYGRKSTLREHMRIHENDRRFKCDICEMAFVQKCSWRGHMLSKHGQQV